MKRIVTLMTVGLLAVAAAPAAAQGTGPVRPADAKGPLGDERLSDERTVTRIGYPMRVHKVRSGPGRHHLVLRSKLGRGGHPWLQIRLPRRPNGSKGWVPREAFGRLRVLRTSLEVDQRRLKARLFKGGKEVWTASIGVGAPATPTPNGRYWVRERLPNFGGNPAYGPLAFGTAAYSRLSEWPGGGVIGIHGTNAPGAIPGRPSHGCIRVRNDKILQLDRLMRVGTPIWIHR